MTDDLLEVVVGADLLLEVDLLGRELVLEPRDLLEGEGILDIHGDLVGHRSQQLLVVGGEGLAAGAADRQRAETAVARCHRRAADLIDALGEQERDDLGWHALELGAREAQRFAGAERHAGGRSLDRNERMLADQAGDGELDRPHVERLLLVVVDRQAGVLVRDDAAQAFGDGAEERARLERRGDGVVDVEQELQPIAVVAQLALGLFRRLVMQRVVDCERDLAGELLQESDLGGREGVRMAAGNAETAEPAQR